MNPKQVQIISTARILFWKYGLRRVTIEEICEEARVSKMTFYKFFKNKVELAKCILDRIEADATEKYENIMNRDIPFQEKVTETINLKMEQVDQLSSEFYADLHQRKIPELADHFNYLSNKSIQLIVKDYRQAQKKGEIRKDLKIEFILYQLKKLLEMANDPNLIRLYKTPKDLIMELTRFFFYGISPGDLNEE